MSEIRISEGHHRILQQHLFRHDHDEHGVAVLAGVRRSAAGVRLLVRDVLPVPDAEFPPGEHGYRMFSPRFLVAAGRQAARDHLALVLMHNHPAADTQVALSADDRAGHERTFPHLLDITDGMPVAGLALGRRSAAGEIWTHEGRTRLDHLTVLGSTWQRLSPGPPRCDEQANRYDRQVRMFGSAGQTRIRALHVAVIGAGGGGSLVVQTLAHLGVGEITVIDWDHVSEHNLSRIVGSRPDDARRAHKKVAVAKRMVRQIDPSIRVNPIDGDISDPDVAAAVVDCDALFLATDTHTSRLVANALACAHLMPIIQIGAKVDTDRHGRVSAIYSVIRPVAPGAACLYCMRAIDPLVLQREAASEEERVAQNYVDAPAVVDPSVITLNATGAAAATGALLLATVGLGHTALWQPRIADAITGEWRSLRPHRDPNCPWCSRADNSQYGRGDRALVPTRVSSLVAATSALGGRSATVVVRSPAPRM